MKHEGKQLDLLLTIDKRSKSEIAELIGISRQQLYDLFKKESIGVYYIECLKKIGIDVLQSLTNVNKPNTPYGKMKQPNAKPVPYLNVDVTAGGVDVFAESNQHIKEYISIPQFNDADMYVNVYGDSMYKTFPSGCIVALKKIIDLDVVEYGKHYVVVTAERRMIKQLRKGELGFFKLVSEHKEHDEFEVHRGKIQSLYLVLGKISKDVM